MRPQTIASSARSSVISTHSVLRNTYLLLSLTLLFSAGTAWYSMFSHAKPVGFLVLLLGMFGLYFLTVSLRNSPLGILAVFAYTGFMGYVLGPILNMFLHTYTNGAQIITTALGATGIIFFGLSAFVLVTRRDFSYMAGFIAVIAMAAFVLSLFGVFFHMPVMQLLISGAFAVVSAGYILVITSQIIHNGETNTIMATIGIYIAIFNLFTSLLQILGAFSGRRN